MTSTKEGGSGSGRGVMLIAVAIMSCVGIGVGFVIGWFTSQMPSGGNGYIFVNLNVFDGSKLKQYGGLAMPLVADYEGAAIVAPTLATHLTTKANGDSKDMGVFGYLGGASERGVVLQFPSGAAAREWYTSQEYKKALAIRLTAADAIFTLVEHDGSLDIGKGGALVAVIATVKNGDKFKSYAGKAGPLIKKHGGSVLIPPTPRSTLTDRQPPMVATAGNRVFVLIKFTSASGPTDWYKDPEYQALIADREEAMDAVMTAIST